ncbi:MAG: CDGSH iron-sulfur domain-containing protein [Bacteroidales bacterium]|nr:CDGSH iron-sulfur domain-containing protein [Bacteroidales bacterium]
MEEPKIAQSHPYVMVMEPGEYYWCACGQSKNQPFCDGSHKTTSFTPVKFEVKEKKVIAWCGCKHTKNKPLCDSSHLVV